MAEQIQESIEIKAPIQRVWQALSDYRAFGEWFQVKLSGPFVVGEKQTGEITYPGYEGLPWEARVIAIEPEHYFAYRWPAVTEENTEENTEASESETEENWTLVEFRLEACATDTTRLTITESGFEQVPAHRRAVAFRQNREGWGIQARQIRDYVQDQKQAVRRFLKQVASGEVQAAYEALIAPHFIHHNAHFKGDRQSLLIGMQVAAEQNPTKRISIKQVFEDGANVICHSHVQQDPDDLGGAVVHIFRFEKGQVVELWDLGQALSSDSPNQHGPF